jgi:hypothetical protein
MATKRVIDRNTTFFNNGAVAVVDIMGFKGIWRRFWPPGVIYKLRTMSERFEAAFRGPIVHGAGARRTFVALSDTMVLSSSVTESEDDDEEQEDDGGVEEWMVLGDLCGALEALWLSAVRETSTARPPLTLRGAVAWGEHLTWNYPYILGPAVDEAAEGEKAPVGALIFFTPTAEAVLNRVFEDEGFRNSGIPVVRHVIKVRSQDGIAERECWVVRPRVTAQEIREQLRIAFRLDTLKGEELQKIQAKFEETMRLFDETESPVRR